MSFQADDTVVNLHACFLQTSRPANVGRSVKSRFQFHHNCNFFACSCRNQSADDWRILTGSIERLLDAEYIGIIRGAFNELHDGQIRIVRMMQKDVVLAQSVEHSGSFAAQGQIPRGVNG